MPAMTTWTETLAELVDFAGAAAVVVRENVEPEVAQRMASAMGKHCRAHDVERPLLIFGDIEMLDTAEMAAAGWWRLSPTDQGTIMEALRIAGAASGPMFRAMFADLAARLTPADVTETEPA